jgi:predicted signal transduction protein with EAL and GGDEF domain
VIDMTLTPAGLALVSTIISLAHALRLKVVAEGVETEEQSRLLRLLNCDAMQGFLFSKPVPADAFESAFLRAPATGTGRGEAASAHPRRAAGEHRAARRLGDHQSRSTKRGGIRGGERVRGAGQAGRP